MPGFDTDRLPTIDAGEVRLRWIEEADVPELHAVFGDPRVTRYWSAPPLADIEAAHDLLATIREHFRRGDLYQWGVALADGDRLIGTCTLAEIDHAHRRAQIGFALGHAWHGRGLMRPALDALLDVAFGRLGLHRIEAEVDPRNAASISLLGRLGFVREGHLRERWRLHGEIQDALVFGLLPRDRDDRPPGADGRRVPDTGRT